MLMGPGIDQIIHCEDRGPNSTADVLHRAPEPSDRCRSAGKVRRYVWSPKEWNSDLGNGNDVENVQKIQVIATGPQQIDGRE